MSPLFILASPIGNLKDCSERFVETCQTTDLIACEDTRITGQLLNQLNIKKQLISLEKHSEHTRIPVLLDKLKSGARVAFISDAGTPNVSDPGALLVQKCHENNIPVIPIPGPSAITTLLSVAGILANQFIFLGFLPKSTTQKTALFENISELEWPAVFFESPHRLMATLKDLESLPVSRICLGKELTKSHETLIQGSLSEVKDKIKDIPIKGEWVGVVHFSKPEKTASDAFVETCLKENMSPSQIIAIGTKWMGFSKNDLYKRVHHD